MKLVELCEGLDLIGAELVGVDGTMPKRLNSRSMNFNRQKLEYSIKRLEAHIAEHLKEVEKKLS